MFLFESQSASKPERVKVRDHVMSSERVRKDIWCFERDGSNMVEPVKNIALCFVEEGKQWFQRYTDPLVTCPTYYRNGYQT
jgi:hypothetical protein